MHYLLMVSNEKSMLFRAELLIRSIKKFSYNKPVVFSLVINGTQNSEIDKNLKLIDCTVENDYISKNSSVFYCPYHWKIPFPSRWLIDPKMETCIFIDADVIACNDLSQLYNLEKNKIHGVTAFDNKILSSEKWKKIGFFEDDLKNYFNYGVVIVPSKYVSNIGKEILNNFLKIKNIFKEQEYFTGQITLAYVLKKMNLPVNILPNKFNHVDMLLPNKIEEIIFLHYILNKKNISKISDLFIRSENKYMELIRKTANKIYLNYM